MSMTNKPNILFITDDEHRYDFAEMSGRFPVRTPNLARLAREGVWHRHAYSNCPLCMPARCSLHTGLYAHQHGLNRNVLHWPLGLPTMPQALRRAGYHTAAIGKLHIHEGVYRPVDLTKLADKAQALGYDDVHEVSGKTLSWYSDCEWTHHIAAKGLLEKYRSYRRNSPREGHWPFPLDAEDYMDVYVSDRVVEWLEQYDDQSPFFLWAGLVSPHPSYDAPAEELARHPVEDQPLPVDNHDPGQWPHKRAHYIAMVEIVDRQVGRMLDVLERRGILDDTLVIFASDHGEMLGDHGLAYKCYPYDPSTRVPLLARYPRLIRPGTVSDALVELIDLTATCLEVGQCTNATEDLNRSPDVSAVENEHILAHRWRDEMEYLPGSPAHSLVAHWQNPSQPHRAFVYSEDGGQFFPAFQMVRTERWKYVFYPRDRREKLFDMQEDPDECVNLADSTEHQGVKDELNVTLLKHIADTPPPVRD